MARFLQVKFLLLSSFISSQSFILPLKKTDGSLDNEHLVGHMTLIEQTLSDFQKTIASQNADIAALRTDISNLKANQQVDARQDTDITTLKTEVANLKANQQAAANQDSDIAALKTEISNIKVGQLNLDSRTFDLQKQIQANQIAARVASMQRVVNAATAELRSVSDQLISWSSRFNNFTLDYQSLTAKVNSTGATRDVELLALDQKYQLLSSTLNSTGAATEAKLKSLDVNYQKLSSEVNSTWSAMDSDIKTLKYNLQSVSSRVNSTDVQTNIDLKLIQHRYEALASQLHEHVNVTDQNLTESLHLMNDTLSTVLSEVSNAEKDRLLFHSCVTSLNETVSELNEIHNTTTTELASITSKIALLNTEVGFEIWTHAYPTQMNVAARTVLKFGNIQSNLGAGYSTSTGMFTAPVTGTYLFWTQVEKVHGPDMLIYINKGHVRIGYFYTPTAGYVTGSVIAYARVQAGEQVHVTVADDITIYCGFSSKFGGVLLYRH